MCDAEDGDIVSTLPGSSRAALTFTVLPTRRAPFKNVNDPTSACQILQQEELDPSSASLFLVIKPNLDGNM